MDGGLVSTQHVGRLIAAARIRAAAASIRVTAARIRAAAGPNLIRPIQAVEALTRWLRAEDRVGDRSVAGIRTLERLLVDQLAELDDDRRVSSNPVVGVRYRCDQKRLRRFAVKVLDATRHVQKAADRLGEPIAGDDDLAASIDLAARICDPDPDAAQIVAANSVRQLADGNEFLFSDLDETERRGPEDQGKLWSVRWEAPAS